MNDMSKPPNTKPPLPAGLVAMRQAKRAAYEALDAETKAEADLWQRTYRAERTAASATRKAARREMLGAVIQHWGEGESAAEIAFAVNRHVTIVWDLLADFGLKCGVSVERRWRRFWLKKEHDVALHRLAHDGGVPVVEMLERLGSALLADDALIARRTLKIQRKAAPK